MAVRDLKLKAAEPVSEEFDGADYESGRILRINL
jgi:hypothetical protein